MGGVTTVAACDFTDGLEHDPVRPLAATTSVSIGATWGSPVTVVIDRRQCLVPRLSLQSGDCLLYTSPSPRD